MTRLERLALLVVFGLLLAGLVALAPIAGALGGTAGGVLGLLVSSRLRRLSGRMDKTLGASDVRTGFRPRTVIVRAVVQLAVLGSLLLGLGLLPFVGDELFAAAGAAVTALPAVLTARRLR